MSGKTFHLKTTASPIVMVQLKICSSSIVQIVDSQQFFFFGKHWIKKGISHETPMVDVIKKDLPHRTTANCELCEVTVAQKRDTAQGQKQNVGRVTRLAAREM